MLCLEVAKVGRMVTEVDGDGSRRRVTELSSRGRRGSIPRLTQRVPIRPFHFSTSPPNTNPSPMSADEYVQKNALSLSSFLFLKLLTKVSCSHTEAHAPRPVLFAPCSFPAAGRGQFSRFRNCPPVPLTDLAQTRSRSTHSSTMSS